MAEYSVVRVADVPDMAADVGMDPDHFEIRFLREPLALRNFAVTFERFGGELAAGSRSPAHGSGGGLFPRLGSSAGQARR